MVASLSAAPAISISVGSSSASGIGGHHGSSGGRSASSASASTSDSPSVVARSSSDEGSSTVSALQGPAEGSLSGEFAMQELQQQWLQSVSIKIWIPGRVAIIPIWWPDGSISCCPGAGGQEPEDPLWEAQSHSGERYPSPA